MSRIWIQGAGELASGVAWRLLQCGYHVRMAEVANPLAVRRLVAFSEAVYEGRCVVEGRVGKLLAAQDTAPERGLAEVLVDPRGAGLPAYAPHAVIDARMTKKRPEPLPESSALGIGLGPGFRCGRDVDCIIETHRAARLGEVIRTGEAAPNTGTPGLVGGQTSRRVVYSPVAGHLVPRRAIGDLVEEGEVLGTVGGQEVRSGLAGRVRGLVHHRAELSAGEKVGDIDPRGQEADPSRITDKGLAIAGGVLEALLSAGIVPTAVGR
ncbi:molybdenum hydroxylase [bacterium DOLJORAL78_65_58]|nr:MAG: molybdenum hydroxylase [bacterium DOLZORAL124_64_63]PIE75852.1 MAG: molybdenum hydroxylase [bacterium DOLJORAL78_65_58]